MRPQHCARQGFQHTSTGTSVVSTASCALPNKLNVALILPIDFNVEIPKPDVEGNCCSGFPADAGSKALETSRARPWHQGRLIEDMLQPPAGSCSGRQWQVKSSQVLHARRRPLGGAGEENTTLQLHVIIHSVSRCQTAVEHDITSSSELFGTQSVFERLTLPAVATRRNQGKRTVIVEVARNTSPNTSTSTRRRRGGGSSTSGTSKRRNNAKNNDSNGTNTGNGGGGGGRCHNRIVVRNSNDRNSRSGRTGSRNTTSNTSGSINGSCFFFRIFFSRLFPSAAGSRSSGPGRARARPSAV